MKFIDKVLSGEEFADSISEYVQKWHESNSNEEIYAFLGFTLQEYALWVENPDALNSILYQRKTREEVPIQDWAGLHLLAARSQTQHDSEKLTGWLKQKGYL